MLNLKLKSYENKTNTKASTIKAAKKGKPVDYIKAFNLTGCTTLRSRISDFIKDGFKFKKERVNHTTRYKTKGQHVCYTMDIEHAKRKKLI